MKYIFVFIAALSWPLTVSAHPGNTIGLLDLDDPPIERQEQGAEWREVSAESARFLTLQHVYRISLQPKTRRYLGGPFFGDYASSIKGLRGWEDGDGRFTNYVLHPMGGAVSGFVLLQNSADAENIEFGTSRRYWRSRLKAFGVAALYSTQFELGPLSEASIGNVGKARGTMGFVDLVITPTGGFVWILGEDALDRFVIRKLERKEWKRKGLIRFVRVALNPTRSFANVLRFRAPWYRSGRELNRLSPLEATGTEEETTIDTSVATAYEQ